MAKHNKDVGVDHMIDGGHVPHFWYTLCSFVK